MRVGCDWRPIPDGPRLETTAERAADDQPFVTRVPVGYYALTVRELDEPNRSYLLASPFVVDVSSSGYVGTHDVSYGGRIQLDVRTGDGARRLGGTFTLTDARGRDVTPRTSVFDSDGTRHVGARGELQARNANVFDVVLPPGDYTLEAVLEGNRRVHETVTVEAGTVTRVRRRLP